MKCIDTLLLGRHWFGPELLLEPTWSWLGLLKPTGVRLGLLLRQAAGARLCLTDTLGMGRRVPWGSSTLGLGQLA